MTYRYPWRAMLPDYARACFGLGCTLIPLLFMDASAAVAAVLLFLGLIFTLFALQAVLRQATRIAVNEREIRARPLGPRLAWDALSGLKLAYFSVRRSAGGGWMELKLQSAGRSLRMDSRLEGFSEVVRQAAAAATDACLHLDGATISNLAILSIDFQQSHSRSSARLQEQD
jgi:hypothetical protein